MWLKKIDELWEQSSLIWLYGVRRVGKTYLCRSIRGIEYFDCELPGVRRMLDDPEGFFKELKGKKVVIDEIHRLGNPSEVLKIATDYFPDTKVIATGSSTLGSSAKFRDTLTGRKKNLRLVPMIWQDLVDFGNTSLTRRFLYGGLPHLFLSGSVPEREFQDWMDDFWAKDIQELFRIERRYSFQKCIELIFTQSGSIFEATRFSKPCEVSRETVNNYLKVLEATSIVNIIRPFSSYKPSEIISAPRVYAFDTGFVCSWKGWEKLRQEDLGILWEHFVLNEIYGNLQTEKVYYWRDKRGHEVDFVMTPKKGMPIAIECTWTYDGFEPKNLIAFRKRYPDGKNIVVAHNVDRAFSQRYENISVKFISLPALIKESEQ